MLQRTQDQPRLECSAWIVEQSEQLLRSLVVQDAAEAIALDDRLGIRREVTKISEADAVDPGRQPAFPAAPDQSRSCSSVARLANCYAREKP